LTVRPSQELRQQEPLRLDLPGEGDSFALQRYQGGVAEVYEQSATAGNLSGRISSLSQMLDIEQAYGHGFLCIPVFLAVGAVIWFSSLQTPSPYLLAGGFCLAGTLALTLRYRAAPLAGLLNLVALCLAGMLLAQLESWRQDTVIIDTPVTTVVSGVVERREVDARGYWRYIISVTGTENPVLSRPPQKITALSRSRHQPIEIGQGVTGRARLSPPSGPALPGLNDFAFSGYFNGIGATGFFYGAPQPAVSEAIKRRIAERGHWLSVTDTGLYQLRSAIAERIRSTIGGDAGAFAASIITDERRAISETTMEALRVSGLAHIVAISGLNMALASGIFFVGLRTALSCFPGFAERRPVKKIAAFAALIMTLAYYLISGFAVSAERAWLMMSIMLIAVLFDRPSISLRNVAISAIIIICVSPSEVMGPSFQMSFAATIALVAAYGFWTRHRAAQDSATFRPTHMPIALKGLSILGSFCAGIIVTSLIGGVSTAIYSMEHFHRVTTYGLAANLAAMPVMSFIVMPFALIAMLLMPFGLDGPFLTVMGYGMAMTIDIATYVASWGGDAGVGRQHQWFLGAGTLGLLALTLFRTRLAWVSAVFLLAGLVLFVLSRQQDNPDLVVFEDGKLMALVGEDQVASTSQRPSGFIYDQWARALFLPDKYIRPNMLPELPAPEPSPDDANDKTTGNTDAAPPRSRRPMLDDDTIQTERQVMSAAVTNASDAFTCRRDSWCIARSAKGQVVISVLDNRYLGLACDIGSVVITTRPTSFETCRSGAFLLSAQTLRRTGSLEITFSTEATTAANQDLPIERMTAAIYGSYRPWTMHRYYNWRSRTFETAVPPHVSQLLDRH
jgi:competence protein ComEC